MAGDGEELDFNFSSVGALDFVGEAVEEDGAVGFGGDGGKVAFAFIGELFMDDFEVSGFSA